MSKTLRRPPVRGTKDPDMPGHVLVPVRKAPAGFPVVNYSVPDTSYFRVDTRTNRPVAIVTVTPNGVSLGWDACGTCTRGLRLCACKLGISLPYSIEYCYISMGGQKSLPLPNAVRFQEPTPTPKKTLRRVEPVTPKRKLLRRASMDRIADKEAEVAVQAALKRLRRP